MIHIHCLAARRQKQQSQQQQSLQVKGDGGSDEVTRKPGTDGGVAASRAADYTVAPQDGVSPLSKPMKWHRHLVSNFFHHVPTNMARAEIERLEGEDGMVPPYMRQKALDHMYGGAA